MGSVVQRRCLTGTPGVVRSPADAAALGDGLGVWAHPDDETFLSSALMVRARRADSRVVCVTATRGEHGTGDPARWPPDRLARTRQLEVKAAKAVLAVDEHRCLGFEDGTLGDHPHAEGVALVAELIAEVDPDTIVTFGSEGMTGHPDHRAVAAWVADAWRRSASRSRSWRRAGRPAGRRDRRGAGEGSGDAPASCRPRRRRASPTSSPTCTTPTPSSAGGCHCARPTPRSPSRCRSMTSSTT
jgi:LmbE family N-acetylglucosaminyl deacetylase